MNEVTNTENESQFELDPKEMVERVKKLLSNSISVVTFKLWFNDIGLVEYDKEKKLLILVANSMTAKRYLLTNYKPQLESAIEQIFPANTNVVIFDYEEENEYHLNKEKEKQEQAEREKNMKEDEQLKLAFNPLYTFDNFIVGKSNQFVCAACKAVAEVPGKKFNPLFIYGGVGLGKTHLLHAIGNELMKTHPEKKICYVTCEKFTNDYIDSLRSGKDNATTDFRVKYRGVDVLMVDDIQFLSNKSSTQEEFFHTFNDLYSMNKQIIISSDRPPKEIATLEERLRSRFSCGLIQDMQNPDLETRVAILRKKAELEGYYLNDEVIFFIAENVNSHIRDLEGVLSTVFFYANLSGRKSATLEDAQTALKAVPKQELKAELSYEKIINSVCNYFNISENDLIGKKKNKEIVEPRMIAIYLVYKLLNLPLVTIGSKFGGKDHTTIMHARNKIEKELDDGNIKFKNYIRDIMQLCDLENN